MTVAYLDPRIGATFPIGTPISCDPDHRPLLLTGLPGIAPGDVDRGTRTL
jgi:hypothetical protein